MKKLKKLVLRKEVIANLNQNEMKELIGGATASGLPTCAICTYGCICDALKTPTPPPTTPPTPMATNGNATCPNYTFIFQYCL